MRLCSTVAPLRSAQHAICCMLLPGTRATTTHATSPFTTAAPPTSFLVSRRQLAPPSREVAPSRCRQPMRPVAARGTTSLSSAAGRRRSRHSNFTSAPPLRHTTGSAPCLLPDAERCHCCAAGAVQALSDASVLHWAQMPPPLTNSLHPQAGCLSPPVRSPRAAPSHLRCPTTVESPSRCSSPRHPLLTRRVRHSAMATSSSSVSHSSERASPPWLSSRAVVTRRTEPELVVPFVVPKPP
jgi:hypothetical protein